MEDNQDMLLQPDYKSMYQQSEEELARLSEKYDKLRSEKYEVEAKLYKYQTAFEMLVAELKRTRL